MMILLGIINYTYTWYNPTAAVDPESFACIATDIIRNRISVGGIGKEK